MTKIILMRHGQTEANIKQIYQGQGDSELSKDGIKQAKLAAKFLSKIKIDVIFCSDLIRSVETANIIAKHQDGVKVIKDKNLRERFYGDWEGLTFEEIAKKYKKLYNIWLTNPAKAKIPNAESLTKLQNRAIKSVKSIIKKYPNKTILIVGHGGINRTILFYFLGVPLNNFWRIKQDNCCINIIEQYEKNFRVSLLNSTCFLKELRLNKKDVLA